MTDLPHTNQGYIQSESTDFRRPTDEQIYNQLGSNVNYLIDQTNALVATATAAFLLSVLGQHSSQAFTTNGSGNFSGTLFSTPNGKPLMFAAISASISTFRNACPLILLPAVSLVEAPLFSSNGQSTTDTGIFPLVQGKIAGTNNNQISANIVNGTPSRWSGGTGGTLYFAAVYQL